MARIRSVHPKICLSETMAALPAELERTYVRLWTHCDDDGRAIDNPRLIKAALFPLHDDMTFEVVDAHLSALEQAGLIVRYTATDGRRCLSIPTWAEYQKPQKKRESDIPPLPEGYEPPTVALPERYGPVVGVVVGVGEGDVVMAPKTSARNGTRQTSSKPRPPDPLWDALIAACEIVKPIPASSRAGYNKVLKELRDVNATPADITARVPVLRAKWPGVAVTPFSLAKHWPELVPQRTNGTPARVTFVEEVVCDEPF